MKTKILVFKGENGLWSYCLDFMRHHVGFRFGEIETLDEALELVYHDQTIPKNSVIEVENLKNLPNVSSEEG